MQITIYTDGACDIHAPNQPGGWAAILRATDENGNIIKESVISGGAELTTNNRMELRAVIEALKILQRNSDLTLVTDSRYVIDIAGGARQPKKNQADWMEFFRVSARHQINWRYVKGHAGDTLNERCDRLAVAEKNKRAKPKSEPMDEPVPASDDMIQIYLSTQYSNKARAAAWAGAIVYDGNIRYLGGRLASKTELEATLIGAVKCLENLPAKRETILFTAQEYLSKGMNQWLAGWSAKGWKTRNGEPVKYRRHWERLQQLARGSQVQFKFVKSRLEHPHFQRGKELATEILSRA